MVDLPLYLDMYSYLRITRSSSTTISKRLIFHSSGAFKIVKKCYCKSENATLPYKIICKRWNANNRPCRGIQAALPQAAQKRYVYTDTSLLKEGDDIESNEANAETNDPENKALQSQIESEDSCSPVDDSEDIYRLPIHDPTPEVRADEFNKLPIKCHSCGSFMQTENPEYHGYIFPKKLPSLLKNSFEEFTCSNCFSLRYKNAQLLTSINRDTVMRQFQHLPYTKALVIYVVDVTDVGGSVYPDLLDIIGWKKRIIIVGNKVDMLALDDKPRQQEANMMNALKKHCISEGLDSANVKDICLVSGKTGHGIEKLVVLINKYREKNMDLYIVGTSNVGKSAIYNMLQNLSCISKNASIPVQAISHYVPGTTLGLLRHPLAYWRMKKLRNMLLEKPTEDHVDEEQEKFEFVEEIIDEIVSKKKKTPNDENDPNSEKQLVANKDSRPFEFVKSSNAEEEKFWMYDTPGLINNQQITQFLTQKEVKFLQQKLWMVPKTFILKPGNSLLVGGLARIDYCGITRQSKNNPSEEDIIPKGSQSIYCTLFCSNNIPVHPTNREKAPNILEKHFGDHILKIPFGDNERKALFPPLQPHTYEVTGVGWESSCADLSLAGIGWIALTAGKYSRITIELHTPNGIGQHLREECLMPFSVTKRGKRGVPHLGKSNKKMYQCTRKENPQLISSFEKQNEIIKAWMTKIEEKQKIQRFQRKEERRKLLLEQGIVGSMRRLAAEVDFIEAEAAKALESGDK